MRDFKKPGFGGPRGGGSFGRPNTGRPSYNDRGPSNRGRDDGFGRSEMYEAVCANCGNKCEVPFRPNGQKPVYCRECFGKQDHAPSNSAPRRDFGARPPFRPSQGQPAARDGRIDEIKKQLDAMSAKIDQLLNSKREAPAMTPKPVTAEAPATSGKKEGKTPKVSKKKSVTKSK